MQRQSKAHNNFYSRSENYLKCKARPLKSRVSPTIVPETKINKMKNEMMQALTTERWITV